MVARQDKAESIRLGFDGPKSTNDSMRGALVAALRIQVAFHQIRLKLRIDLPQIMPPSRELRPLAGAEFVAKFLRALGDATKVIFEKVPFAFFVGRVGEWVYRRVCHPFPLLRLGLILLS